MTALLQTAPCAGCERTIVQCPDGRWAHPGGAIDIYACAECGHQAGTWNLPCRICKDATIWQHDHTAAPLPESPHEQPWPKPAPGIGWTVWSTQRRNHLDYAIGGVVVAIDDTINRETGEVVRGYVTVHHYLDTLAGRRVTIRTLSQDEVSEGERPDDHQVLKVIKALCEDGLELCKGPMTQTRRTHLGDVVAWLHTLGGVLMGGAS